MNGKTRGEHLQSLGEIASAPVKAIELLGESPDREDVTSRIRG